MSAVAEIIFQVGPCAENGGGGIATQGDSFAELEAMIADAAGGYFGSNKSFQTRLTLA